MFTWLKRLRGLDDHTLEVDAKYEEKAKALAKRHCDLDALDAKLTDISEAAKGSATKVKRFNSTLSMTLPTGFTFDGTADTSADSKS